MYYAIVTIYHPRRGTRRQLVRIRHIFNPRLSPTPPFMGRKLVDSTSSPRHGQDNMEIPSSAQVHAFVCPGLLWEYGKGMRTVESVTNQAVFDATLLSSRANQGLEAVALFVH